MCCTKIEIKTYCLQAFAIVLAWIGKQLHTSLVKLNNIWYRFSLYSLAEIARWPNQTTGVLQPVAYSQVLVSKEMLRQETWV